jgi:hypothetical protein
MKIYLHFCTDRERNSLVYRKEEHNTNVVSNTIPVRSTALQTNRGTQSVRIEAFLNLFSGNSNFLKTFIWD